jgi:tRNA A37 threonylcarbamoyladenosine dehydratase
MINNNEIFERLTLITGTDGLDRLRKTHVMVFGAGGVGSWCAEALVRSGIGKITIVDFDKVAESNINRQIQATSKTVGLSKVGVLKERLLEINPACEVAAINELFCAENSAAFGIEKADYVIDAIDMLVNKLDLIEKTCAAGVTLYSSMGMALKTDPSKIKSGSIWDTRECPLARLVRQGLRKRGFTPPFTAVYSLEKPLRGATVFKAGQKPVNGSIVTVTASAGLLLASLVLRDVARLAGGGG